MKGIFKSVLLITMIFTFNRSTAQTKEFENVIQVKLENTVTIRNNNTIVGYAFFYQVDKMKKAAFYRLEILDENLKTIGSSEFEGSKKLNLDDAVYESDHILLAFSDFEKPAGSQKFSKIYDLSGKETGEVPFVADKVKKGLFGGQIASQMARYYNGYNNVEGKGFVCVYQSSAKTGGVDIQMISKEGKLKWEKNLTNEDGGRMEVYLTTTTSNALIFFASLRGGVMSKDAKNFLIGLNPENGKELYRKSMEIDQNAWEPMLFKTDAQNNLKMISSLTHEDEKFYTAKPIGFNISEFNDKTGQIKSEKNFLFEKDLDRVLNMKNESKSEDGFIKMHDICLMPDGSKVLVGEFFRKTVSAKGVVFKILTEGGASAAQISIGDMFLLRIDPKDKATALERIEKGIQRFPTPTDGVSVALMARILTLENRFGYIYTDENGEAGKKTVVLNGSLDGENYGTSAVTFSEKKGFTIKKFTPEKSKNDRVYFKRAKPGHLLVMKYVAKEKKITLNLERIS